MAVESTVLRHPASYRDPSGFIFKRHGCVLRQVNGSYRADYEQLMSSGLYEELTAAGWLVPHEEAPLDWSADREAYKVLRPAQLPFISYPYEWSFSQLREAALLTLRIQQRALAKGMTLKDASAYNVQLFNGTPALIDTLSFERYEPGRPWVAYRQFCQHFLAPLALMSRVDVRLNQLLRVHIDGVPLDLASQLLPWRTKFSLGLGLHIHAHAKSQQKHAHSAVNHPQRRHNDAAKSGPQISLRQQQAIFVGLENAVGALSWKPEGTEWADYYAANNNYGDNGLQAKETLMRELIAQIRPRSVWDLGANNGRFSRLALENGAETVVAWDVDPACVEQNYRHVRQRNETSLHPLLVDLTNPSPGIGWSNTERTSFAERGPVDAVFALGLVHHLAISNNVPLPQVAAYIATLGRSAIVEWVPKEDSQVEKLLATRKDVFPNYVQAKFEEAIRVCFQVEAARAVPGTKRTLYLLRKTN